MARRNPIDNIPGLSRVTGPVRDAASMARHPRDAVAVVLHQARTTTALGRTVAGQVVEQVAHVAQAAHLRETAEAVRQRVLTRGRGSSYGRPGTDAPSVEPAPPHAPEKQAAVTPAKRPTPKKAAPRPAPPKTRPAAKKAPAKKAPATKAADTPSGKLPPQRKPTAPVPDVAVTSDDLAAARQASPADLDGTGRDS